MPPRQNPLWGLLRETPNTDIGGEWMHFYYRPQRNWVKVMFLQASVILSTGGLQQGNPPPLARRPPRQGDPPWEQTPPPGADPPWDQPPSPRDQTPPPGSRLQHTVNERPVRILLECILVFYCFYWKHHQCCLGIGDLLR